MLRLTLFLCAAMVGALMLLGEDRGQKRPGLAKAAAEGPAPVTAAVEEAAPMVVTAAPQPVVAPAATPVAAPAPKPYVELARDVVQTMEEPVFTLSSLGNELVPGEDGTALIAEQPGAGPAEGIWYVNGNSVNVRSEPSTEAEVLGKLANGEAALMVSAIDGEWARIVIQGDGLEGYVALRYLSPEAP